MENLLKYPFRAAVLLSLALTQLIPGPAAADDILLRAELGRLLQPAIVATPAPASEAAKHHPELVGLYRERQFAPVWESPKRRTQLLAALSALGEDGLDPEHYALSRLRQLAFASGSTEQRARFDILATDACLRALTHLQRGRLDASQAGRFWRAPSLPAPPLPSPVDALANLANDDIGALFEHFRPKTPLYRMLRAALAQASQATVQGEWPQVSPGPTLKPDMRDPRVVELRARLNASGHLGADNADSEDMDAAVVEAVKAFQDDHGLETDGKVGRATIAALNQSRHARLAQLRINLERARWIAAAPQNEVLLVDVAAYRLAYYRDSVPIWSARTQVGMPTRESPELFSRITHFTVNPTWTVPPTILKKDIVPMASTDPDYLASRNIRVLDRDGQEVDPATVDWTHTADLTFRQDFGEGSALGKVAIRFANPYAIYLHDTPNQRQFKRTQRTFSSGCVRVENAIELVRLLIERGGSAQQARFDAALASGKTGNLNLPQPVPIIVAYLTAGPDENGRIIFRPDIYDRDPALIKALENPDH